MRRLAAVLLFFALPASAQTFDICTAADSSGTEVDADRVLLCDKTSDVPISVTLGSIRPPASETVAGICELSTSAETTAGLCVQASDTRLSDPRTPSGSASGDLSGTYPSPALAADTVGLDELAACAGPGEIVEYGASGIPACVATPGGGSSIILDLGDDGTNESTALGEIATVNMPASMWTEPTADKLLVDGSVPWTTATQVDLDGDGTLNIMPSLGIMGFDGSDVGTVTWGIGTLYFRAENGNGPALYRETPSATNPTVMPNKSDDDTGIGWSGANQVSIVAGGVEAVQVAHDGSRALTTITDLLRLHNAATPPVACTAGISGSMFYDTTTPSVCVCDGSAWTPMWPAGGDCT